MGDYKLKVLLVTLILCTYEVKKSLSEAHCMEQRTLEIKMQREKGKTPVHGIEEGKWTPKGVCSSCRKRGEPGWVLEYKVFR